MKKGGSILLILSALSIFLVIGIFIGRNLTNDYSQLPLGADSTAVSIEDSTGDFRLDINTATKAQLMDLPGIGEMLAERIIEYRTANGAIQAIEDLMNVEGIGKKKLQSIEELIKVGG